MESKTSLLPTKIKPSEVYEVLEARKFVDKIYNEMLHDIKNTSAYISLKEIAFQQFESIENSELDSKHISQPIKTKTFDVGFLSYRIGSTLTKAVKEKLHTLQDDIYAASQAVIEELERERTIDAEESCSTNSLSTQRETDRSDLTPTIKKRCIRSDSDSNTSPYRGLSKRLKKPNSKYYCEDILTAMTENCFNDELKES